VRYCRVPPQGPLGVQVLHLQFPAEPQHYPAAVVYSSCCRCPGRTPPPAGRRTQPPWHAMAGGGTTFVPTWTLGPGQSTPQQVGGPLQCPTRMRCCAKGALDLPLLFVYVCFQARRPAAGAVASTAAHHPLPNIIRAQQSNSPMSGDVEGCHELMLPLVTLLYAQTSLSNSVLLGASKPA